ncbi:MAG: pyrophosphatase PpaX [Clostridiaceae bacterium]|nr:pyrophosphatase PpaX [Clostridiaceae bacterium]
MIEAVLFDLDGTIVNTNNLILKSFRHTFKTHFKNMDIQDEEIIKLFGEPLKQSMQKYGKENVDKLIDIFHEYNESNHDVLTEGFEGVEDTLKKLKDSGIKLAIVTSKRRIMVERSLNLFNLKHYFDVIVTPEDTKIHKPFAEPALKACELLRVSPSKSLMVGDSHNDILCGKNAGNKTCLVKYTMLPLDELLKYSPDFVIDSIEDILKII